MAQSSVPSPDNSRAVTDVQYEQLTAAPYGDGLIGSPADTALVYADGSGRQVSLRAGRLALLRGHQWTVGATDVVLAIGANGAGSTRTDLIVLGLNRSTWNVAAYVKAGTPGSGAPALQLDTGSTGIYEIPLAEVTVGVGVPTITADKVKTRGWYLRPDGVASAGADTRPPNPWPGMHLWEGTTAYIWNGTSWESISNPPAPAQSFQETDMLGSGDINGDGAWHDVPDDSWDSVSITVPPSGRIEVTVSAWAENRFNTTSTIWVGYRAAGGGMVPGTIAAAMTLRAISARSTRVVASKTCLFTGLVPGQTTTLIPAYQSGPASADGSVTTIRSGNLIVRPA